MSRRIAVVAGFLVVLLLAGCSGADNPGTAASPAASVDQAAAPTPSEPTAGTPTEPEPAPPEPSGDVNPINCPELMASLSAASNAAGAMTGGETDGAAYAVEVMRQWARTGPEEIRDDLTTIADAYETFLRALEAAGVDLSDPMSFANLDPATLAQIEAAAAELDTAEVQQASERIDAFVARECT